MKYPRTFHLPDSPGITKDDRVMKSDAHWRDYNYIVTVSEKLDGENTSLHSDNIHARSVDAKSHPWGNYLKSFWATIKYKIPDNLQVVVENMYAKHSIYYDRLTSYQYITMIIDKREKTVLPLEEIILWSEELEIPMAPVYFHGGYTNFNPEIHIPKRSAFGDEIEGYVVRYSGGFPISEFNTRVGKWVREDHVKTNKHWTRGWIKNKLIGDES